MLIEFWFSELVVSENIKKNFLLRKWAKYRGFDRTLQLETMYHIK